MGTFRVSVASIWLRSSGGPLVAGVIGHGLQLPKGLQFSEPHLNRLPRVEAAPIEKHSDVVL